MQSNSYFNQRPFQYNNSNTFPLRGLKKERIVAKSSLFNILILLTLPYKKTAKILKSILAAKKKIVLKLE